jgi:hypothetical protein
VNADDVQRFGRFGKLLRDLADRHDIPWRVRYSDSYGRE